MSKLTGKDYEAMSDDYEAHPVRADEVIEFEVPDAVVLRKGRPVGGKSRGVTPPLSVRFPNEVRDQIDARAREDGTDASEIVRRAVVQYLNAS